MCPRPCLGPAASGHGCRFLCPSWEPDPPQGRPRPGGPGSTGEARPGCLGPSPPRPQEQPRAGREGAGSPAPARRGLRTPGPAAVCAHGDRPGSRVPVPHGCGRCDLKQSQTRGNRSSTGPNCLFGAPPPERTFVSVPPSPVPPVGQTFSGGPVRASAQLQSGAAGRPAALRAMLGGTRWEAVLPGPDAPNSVTGREGGSRPRPLMPGVFAVGQFVGGRCPETADIPHSPLTPFYC